MQEQSPVRACALKAKLQKTGRYRSARYASGLFFLVQYRSLSYRIRSGTIRSCTDTRSVIPDETDYASAASALAMACS